MGTPHQGSSGVLLEGIMLNVASIFMTANDKILKQLERDSEWLQQQLGQYAPISADFVTKFAYETYPTRIALGRTMMVSNVLVEISMQSHQQLLFRPFAMALLPLVWRMAFSYSVYFLFFHSPFIPVWRGHPSMAFSTCASTLR